MKKFTAFTIIISLLLSCISVTYAAPTRSYSTDMSGTLSSSKRELLNTSGEATNFTFAHNINSTTAHSEFLVAGSAANKKLSSDQMLMAQLYTTNSRYNWTAGYFNMPDSLTLLPGTQVYMRTQYYFPSSSYYGDSYADYDEDAWVSLCGNFYQDGATDTATLRQLVCMRVDDQVGGSFWFMGNNTKYSKGYKAQQTWSYDTWYTIEVIATIGAPGKVSAYVNGSPLTFENQEFTNSVNYSDANEWSGIATQQRFYYMSHDTMPETVMHRHMYTDNWAFEIYPRAESITLWTPPEYNPLSFTSPVDGDEMPTNEFKTVTVDTDAEKCDWVALYVDNELVSSDASAPYSFNITKRYTTGVHTLRALASSDSDTYERTIDINLLEYNPLSFDGIKDGDELYDKKFKSVTVLTDDEECDWVALYVDNELVSSDASAPYSFALPQTLSVGAHTLCARAEADGYPYEFEIDVKVLEYNPVSFSTITDGGKISADDFKSVSILTGDETADEASLYVDDVLVGTLISEPFTFNLTDDYAPGSHTIRTVVTVGSDTYERTSSVTLIGSYNKPAMNETFETYTNFNEADDKGWYYPSSRMTNAKQPDGWYIKPAVVTDKSGASFGQGFLIGCDAGSPSSYKDANNQESTYLNFGFNRMYGSANNAVVSGNKIKMEWYSLFDKDSFTTFNMAFNSKSNSGAFDYMISEWDSTQKKIKWNVAGTPLTSIETNKWQKYTLTVDMTSSPKMSLSIDGNSVFTNLTPNAPFTSFTTVVWRYVPNCAAGSYVALDEIKINHVIPAPSFGSVGFYNGDASDDDASGVSPLADAIALNIDGGALIESSLSDNIEFLENGKVINFADSSGNQLKMHIMLSGSKLWLVPPVPLLPESEYSIMLGGDTLYEDNVKIGYDQYFSFTTGRGEFETESTTFKVNGSASSTVVNGDTVGADIKFSNTSGESKPVKLLLALYSSDKLMSISVKSTTVTASASLQTLSANDATVRDASDFSAKLIVLDSNNYPIAQYTMD